MGYLIDRLDHKGRGITKVEDKTTFVENALPNEIVDIKITHSNSKINEAVMTNIEKKSDIRIEPVCKYYNECGGCNLMHIPYEEELKYKEDKIRQVIEKFTSLDSNIVKPIIGNKNNNYRNKVTLHVDKKLGYYNIKSNEIINIDKCYIVDEKINKIIKDLNKLDLTNVYEIVIRTSKHLNDTMVVFKITDDINIDLDVDTILTYKDKTYNIIKGKGYIEDKIGKYTFKISPDSFFQINTLQAENLYDKVKEYLKPTKEDNILDLYCGTGTIGIYVSEYSKHIKGIEINEYAIKDANINKEINNIDNIDFECMDASNINKTKEKYDKIIIDPPRSGLDKNTINYIINSNSNRVVYVSCDPITLSRDLEILKDYYNVLEITPVDMFSRTYHCESVTVLERR